MVGMLTHEKVYDISKGVVSLVGRPAKPHARRFGSVSASVGRCQNETWNQENDIWSQEHMHKLSTEIKGTCGDFQILICDILSIPCNATRSVHGSPQNCRCRTNKRSVNTFSDCCPCKVAKLRITKAARGRGANEEGP